MNFMGHFKIAFYFIIVIFDLLYSMRTNSRYIYILSFKDMTQRIIKSTPLNFFLDLNKLKQLPKDFMKIAQLINILSNIYSSKVDKPQYSSYYICLLRFSKDSTKHHNYGYLLSVDFPKNSETPIFFPAFVYIIGQTLDFSLHLIFVVEI